MKKPNNFLLRKHLCFIMLTLALTTGCAREMKASSTIESSEDSSSSEIVEVIKQPEEIKVSLYAVGDNLYHESVIIDGESVEDYKSYYSEIAEDIKSADISFVNQETVIAGEELGIGGYPIFNAPDNSGIALAELGFDVVNQASNHTMDKGIAGIQNTIEFWESQPEVTMIGMYSSKEERDNVAIIEREGIKFAFLSYTYGLNGFVLPEDKAYMTNLIDAELIKSDIQKAEQLADVTIVSIHWGNEYSFMTSASQKNFAEMMADEGVELVLGHHTHVPGEIEWIEGENGSKTLVYYGLGNLVHSMEVTSCMLGVAANIEFTKDTEGNISITSATAEGIINHYVDGKKGFKVYPLDEYTHQLANEHGIRNFDIPLTLEYANSVYENVLGEFYQPLSEEALKIPETPLAQVEEWMVALLNKEHAYEGEYPVELTLISGNYDINGRADMKVDSRIVEDLVNMFAAAKEAGNELYLRSAHRTYALQELYYNNTYQSWIDAGKTPEEATSLTSAYLAYPGTSEHHTGLAIDITTPKWEAGGGALTAAFDQTEAFAWLSDNAADYGFILRYPADKTEITGYGYEPWHYRYVGVDLAKELTEKGLTLEEYLGKN